MDWSKTPEELLDHIFGTYVSLRYGLAAIGALLPVVLAGIGIANGLELQSSMSAYYWAAPAGGSSPSRDWLVGSLFAVAACLYLYKGFTAPENLALNLAGLFGAGVALFPTAHVQCVGKCPLLTLHGFCAMAMFGCLGFVVWFCAGDTLTMLSDPDAVARYRMRYAVIGFFMLASPVIAFVMNSILGRGQSYTFWVELAGIWAFAAYWIVKSRELEKSNSTKRALLGEVETTKQGKAIPKAAAQTPPHGQKRG